MFKPGIFNTYFIFPILNLLVFFYKVFLYLRIPGAFGLSIITLTVLVRMILNPFFKQQLETAKKMQDLKPHLDRLSQKHKKEPQKLQQEQLKLYQQAGINPAAGCLFMIIQLPIFFALYQTLFTFFDPKHKLADVVKNVNNVVLYHPFLRITHSIDPWFFGFNLAMTPNKAGVWYYYLIPVITGILQYFQVQSTMVTSPPAEPAAITKTDDKKKDDSGDFQKAMNTQMKYIFPLMIGWFSYTLPVGLSLYWNIFSLFSIIQYKRLKK